MKIDLIKEILQRIKDKKVTDAIYLYGSQAKNETHENSDVDMAILYPDFIKDPLNAKMRTELLRMDILSELNLDDDVLDLVDAELAPIALQFAIINGKLLEGNNYYHIHKFENSIMNKVERNYPEA